MSDQLASWVDGAFVPPGAPAIAADDQGFLLGLAVFETLLQEDGRRYFESQHLARLQDGARTLGIAWPPPYDPADALRDYGESLGAGSFAVRLSISRGSPGGPARMVVGARPVDQDAVSGVAVSIARHVKTLDLSLEGIKNTSRLRNVLAREEAQAEGAWESLIRTTDGDVAEGTVSNLFVVMDGDLWTPPLSRGALAGIVRGELIAGLAEDGVCVREERLTLDDLKRCDELFLTNSLLRVVPVNRVVGLDGEFDPRGDLPGSAGPWAQKAREVLSRREQAADRSASRG